MLEIARYVRNEKLTVGTTSKQIARDLSGIGGRRAIVIRNISSDPADVITLALGTDAAVSGAGIVLKQGEVWYDGNDAGYECWQHEIQAICDTSNGVLSVMER